MVILAEKKLETSKRIIPIIPIRWYVSDRQSFGSVQWPMSCISVQLEFSPWLKFFPAFEIISL